MPGGSGVPARTCAHRTTSPSHYVLDAATLGTGRAVTAHSINIFGGCASSERPSARPSASHLLFRRPPPVRQSIPSIGFGCGVTHSPHPSSSPHIDEARSWQMAVPTPVSPRKILWLLGNNAEGDGGYPARYVESVGKPPPSDMVTCRTSHCSWWRMGVDRNTVLQSVGVRRQPRFKLGPGTR
ncbi:hypothetical protein LY78DRAFT_348020 [Colletotrichum sublineola]|nr:hypothetical protein LY78DRAFT_348020 [Colletotrichum sublineola]